MSDASARYLPLACLSPGDISADRDIRGSADKSAGQTAGYASGANVASGDKPSGDNRMATIAVKDAKDAKTGTVGNVAKDAKDANAGEVGILGTVESAWGEGTYGAADS